MGAGLILNDKDREDILKLLYMLGSIPAEYGVVRLITILEGSDD